MYNPRIFPHPPPPPMPKVVAGQVYLDDAIAAMQRGKSAWNLSQLEDAFNSAEHFINRARLASNIKD